MGGRTGVVSVDAGAELFAPAAIVAQAEERKDSALLAEELKEQGNRCACGSLRSPLASRFGGLLTRWRSHARLHTPPIPRRLYKEGQVAAAELVYTEALKARASPPAGPVPFPPPPSRVRPHACSPPPQYDANNHLLYSNRSLCYGKLGRHTLALEDARTVVAMIPTWPKGFARLAAALEVLGQHAEAVKAYEQAAWLAQSRDGDAAAVAEYEAAVERVRRAQYTGAGRLRRRTCLGSFSLRAYEVSQDLRQALTRAAPRPRRETRLRRGLVRRHERRPPSGAFHG